jgi:phosphomannomutase
VVDEQGRFLRGDVIGLLTASFLHADTVVTPVTSTSAVELSGLFARTLRTRVGSPYVVETMAANMTGVVVGFEANGGVLLGSSLERDGFSLTALPTRDALLPIVTVLALAHQRGSTMSQLIQGLPSRFTASGRIEHVTAEESMLFLPLVADYNDALALLGKDAKITGIDVTDGVKLTLSTNESLHFRASGNAPELRCYSEASTIERAAHLLQLGLAKAETAIMEIRG